MNAPSVQKSGGRWGLTMELVKEPWINNYPKYKEERDKMKETRDCVVVSFSEVWGAPYASAHAHIRRQFKRRNRVGTSDLECRDAINLCPKTKMAKKVWVKKEEQPTLATFCKEHPVGRYWVFVRAHALAVIDGVVYDHSYKPRRKVQYAYRVYV